MTPTPNKLMPWLQATAALVIIALFCALAVGPMFGFKPADADIKETLKAIMLILTGFLFGSAVGNARKDEQNAALTAQLVASPATPAAAGILGGNAAPKGTPEDPVSVTETLPNTNVSPRQ